MAWTFRAIRSASDLRIASLVLRLAGPDAVARIAKAAASTIS